MSKEKDLKYWKANAEEDYKQVPISVLRYISELEEQVNKNSVLAHVSVSLPSDELGKEWSECKRELELKGNAGEMAAYFAMFMHGWRGRNSEGFWQ